MTYKIKVYDDLPMTSLTAAAGLALAAPDGTHVVLVHAEVKPNHAASNVAHVVATWSTVS